ncbi:MAG: hypothetical protein PVI23_09585 [Maricaulaceae bacterium]|jgi:hypothetical protein
MRIATAFAALLLAASPGSAWEPGERAADAPEELEQFAFLVGCYDIAASRWSAETGDFGPSAPARWNGRWALDGWAIYDEWFDVQIPGQAPDLGRGANLRVYETDTGQWVMVWAHTEGPGQVLRAEQREEGLVMWREHPLRDTDWRAVFTVDDDGGWTRVDYSRDFGTDDWTPGGRLAATPTTCQTAE